MLDKQFWNGRRVLVTGHTGFKGSWLSILLLSLGADVMGYSKQPAAEPNMFNVCRLNALIPTVIGDIADIDLLRNTIQSFEPEVVIHMAAQPLVRESYINTLETYSVNIMGTVNLLEILKISNHLKVILNVTTDKCYENKEWVWGYREVDALGGHDPYSASKACSDLITTSYRKSFFAERGIGVATVRAGNVIGGGDWSTDRLIPDSIKALIKGTKIIIRKPHAVRPWQHVLEPLFGYLLLAEKLYKDDHKYSGAWNFGPRDSDVISVENVVRKLSEKWGSGSFEIQNDIELHEATNLKLDCSKASIILDWTPVWEIDKALDKVVNWTTAWIEGKDMHTYTLSQINEYLMGRNKTN
ncbi:CDP-glucose 4,6-dehydratase [Paenibacillus validus]|uniref:CDP-glucose 4,6-dehydratase n=1 Tax=Paenibacillus validus TaxID=44253 RepID=UPI003D275E83